MAVTTAPFVIRTITRDNYHEFCTQPPLTDQETRQFGEFKAYVSRLRNNLQHEFFAFVKDYTVKERVEYEQMSHRNSDDWSDMVGFADACRALFRAQIAALAEYKRLRGENYD